MRKFKLPKQFRRNWLEALEGGKIPQGQNKLKTSKGGYCCLGVAGKVLKVEDYVLLTNNYPYYLDEENREKFPKCLLGRGPRSYALKLANMNDSKFSFKDIAKYIRKTTIGV